ncbi:hypothetical protein HDV04_000311 [Boothiomyces sp. JEL0838]|nr:hypothetical protein HDV04_000311 [Boothiomyces sp. JEL0838]
MDSETSPLLPNITHTTHLDDIKLVCCVILGAVVWNLEIEGLHPSAVQTLAVFLSVMVSIMVTDYPIAILTGLALCVLVLGKAMDCETMEGKWVECKVCGIENCDPYEAGFKTALSGFGHPIAWMILCAFQLGQAVESTLLGRRIALVLMRYMGNKLYGLGLAIFLSEFLLAPFVPSNTARGGGIILPIVMSLVNSLESSPVHKPEIGRYLILCGAHANLLISSFFVTGASPNPVIVGTAHKVLNINFNFFTWTLGAFAPGIVSLIAVSSYIYWTINAEYDGERVVEEAGTQLERMGPLSLKETQLIFVLCSSLILWMTGSWTDIPETFVAFLALVTLLLLGTLGWDEVCKNYKAWDCFFWLAAMLVMAEQLAQLGVATYLGSTCAWLIGHVTSSPIVSAMLLASLYFITMYFFSSITGHAVALSGPFLAAGHSMGCSPWLTTALLAYFSSLSATLTHFSTGTVVLYFAQGYFTTTKWFSIGTVIAVIYLGVYFTVGMVWWKLLDFY